MLVYYIFKFYWKVNIINYKLLLINLDTKFNIMKKIKLIAWAFIAWQIATLFYKDKDFKSKISELDSVEKVKYLFNSLLDLNKKIFFDVKDYDYDNKINLFKSYFDNEKLKLEAKFEELAAQIWKLNEEKLQPLVKDLEEKAYQLKDKVYENVEYFNDKYDLQEKADELVEKIKNLKSRKEV